MKKEIIVENVPKASGPFSEAIQYGDMVYVSGQSAIDLVTGEMPSGENPVATQTEFAILNLQRILRSAGMELDDVVKTLVFIVGDADFATVNKVYTKYFNNVYPARSCVRVSSLPGNALIEIEAVAAKNQHS